jgi:hypothetical protein
MAMRNLSSRLGMGLILGLAGATLLAGCGEKGNTEKAKAPPAATQTQAPAGQTEPAKPMPTVQTPPAGQTPPAEPAPTQAEPAPTNKPSY